MPTTSLQPGFTGFEYPKYGAPLPHQKGQQRYVPWQLASYAGQAGSEQDRILQMVLNELSGQGDAATADVQRGGTIERGANLNSAVNRGLANTSVLFSANSRTNERVAREVSRIKEGVGAQRAGAVGNYGSQRMTLMGQLYRWVLENEGAKKARKGQGAAQYGQLIGAGIGAVAGGLFGGGVGAGPGVQAGGAAGGSIGSLFGGGGSFMPSSSTPYTGPNF